MEILYGDRNEKKPNEESSRARAVSAVHAKIAIGMFQRELEIFRGATTVHDSCNTFDRSR